MNRLTRLTILPLFAFVSGVRADTLLTTDGRVLQGDIRIEGDALSIEPPSGARVRVEAGKLLAARFDSNRRLRQEGGAFKAVVLKAGTVVPVDQFIRGDGRLLRVTRPRPVEVSLLDVPYRELAEIIFSSQRRPQWPEGDVRGVLLKNGDFYQGEVTDLTAERMVVSSALFGERVFDPRTEVIAARVGPVDLPKSAYLVQLTNLATARASRLTLDKGRVVFDDPVLGVLSAGVEDLVRISAPNTVMEARPHVTGSGFSEQIPVLRGEPLWPASGETYPVSREQVIELAVPPRATALYLRFGVSREKLPTRIHMLSAEVDGARMVRGSGGGGGVTSVDDAALVGVEVSGKSRVRLWCEEGQAWVTDLVWVRP